MIPLGPGKTGFSMPDATSKPQGCSLGSRMRSRLSRVRTMPTAAALSAHDHEGRAGLATAAGSSARALSHANLAANRAAHLEVSGEPNAYSGMPTRRRKRRRAPSRRRCTNAATSHCSGRCSGVPVILARPSCEARWRVKLLPSTPICSLTIEVGRPRNGESGNGRKLHVFRRTEAA